MSEYLLEESEIDKFIDQMNLISTRKFDNLFKTIHKSNEQIKTIREFLEPFFDSIVDKREKYVPQLDLLTI